MIQIIVPGEPVAQGRPRFSTINGHMRTYDPKRSRDYKDYVRAVANQVQCKPMEGPLMMTVDVYRAIPKSFSKQKQQDAEAGYIKPAFRPDCDNYVKAIKDALNGIAYFDDGQVVVLIISKYYSSQPRVEIKIEEDPLIGKA